jgi:hypothetical protein
MTERCESRYQSVVPTKAKEKVEMEPVAERDGVGRREANSAARLSCAGYERKQALLSVDRSTKIE